MGNFVHLHVHTQYSLLDGAADITHLIRTAKDLDMPALAITDHGVMYGCLKFYQQASKHGIKPILGCEIYVAPRKISDKVTKLDDNPYHLVLLAENQEGYRNLLKLVSIAHIQGFYYKPRIDWDTLRQHARGLIALSACMSGEIPSLILKNRYPEARERVFLYQEILGPENFFMEIQYQQLADQRNLNKMLAKLASECNVPLVATNDVHYLKKEDAEVHDVLLCIQTGKTVEDTDRMKFPTSEFYLKTATEMEEIFYDYPEAIANTLKIAERCEVRLDFDQFHMPAYQIPQNTSAEAFLENLCRGEIKHKINQWTQDYEERLRYELGVINKMGFSGYFLIVRDFVNFAKESQIMVGPGRGSAAGSLVAYLLGITALNPIEYDLLFERFLNPERISMPDIDIDFCYERRGEVISYVRKRFGEDRVAQIITFGTMAARAAIRDVGRVLGMPYGEVDRIAKMIPQELGISLNEALKQSSELRQWVETNPKVARLLTIAAKVEGFPRHASTHAAGVVITGQPLTDFLPLSQSNEGEIITQFTMEDIETLGLLKMDFLGLRTLTVLRDTIALIDQNRSEKILLTQIPLNDNLTYQILQEGSTLGIFQLESRGIRNLIVRLKPEILNDLTALMALYRPGPLGSGMVDDFILGKHGIKKITYLHPLLEPILKETYGVILYQEQVMRIASDIGGFTLGEADLVRRAMAKKKPEVLASMGEKFIEGAAKQGVSANTGKEIFNLMEFFSGYGFNKSHSAAYGLVVYQTAYFKANFPQEYMAALLTSIMGNSDKISLYIEECRHMGLKILLPSVNNSRSAFAPEGSDIRFGLMGIKNLGIGAIDKIITERETNGKFKSLEDFCRRVNYQLVNKKVIESLIRAGAFDFSGVGRRRMLEDLDGMIERNSRSSSGRNQLNLLEMFDEPQQKPVSNQVNEFTHKELLEQEKEYLGVYLSGHPLDEWSDKFHENGIKPLGEIDEEADGQEVLIGGLVTAWRPITTKSGAMMAGFRLEDLTGTVEVILFPQLYAKVADGYYPERVAIVKGKLEEQERGRKILAAQLRWLGMGESMSST